MKFIIEILLVTFIAIILATTFGSGKQVSSVNIREAAEDVVKVIEGMVKDVKPVASALTEKAKEHVDQLGQKMNEQLEDMKRSDTRKRSQGVIQHHTKQSVGSVKQGSEDLIHRLDALIHSIKDSDGEKS